MEITFAGAAREVTGSCHLLHVGGRTVALDFGLFQGKRSESDRKNRELPMNPAEIDAVVLSHAHIDHAGRLPLLVGKGFRGTIWCTPATRDLSAYMLADAAHIQEKDAEFLTRRHKEHAEPLYNMADAALALEQMVSVPYDRPMEILPGIQVTFVEAGHILGSASVLVEGQEVRAHAVVHGGDGALGQRDLRVTKFPQLDAILGPGRPGGDGACGGAAQELTAGEHSSL